MAQKSRLHRALNTTAGETIFTLTIGSKTFTDNTISEVAITRGGSSYGSNPSTMEVTLPGWHTFKRNEHVELTVTEKYARRFGTSFDQVVWRFHGRVGTLSVDDRGAHKTPVTTVSCSSYSTLLKTAREPITVRQRDAVQNIITAAIDASRVDGKIKIFDLAAYSTLDAGRVYLEDGESIELSFKDVLSEYVEKSKSLLVDMRSGHIRLATLGLRNAVLHSQVNTRFAPLRSTVLAPAKWVQENDVRSNNFRYQWREYDGTTTATARMANASNDALPIAVFTEEQDYTGIVLNAETRGYLMSAFDAEANHALRGYGAITIDVLALLRHGGTYQRYVAFEALRVEHGDALYFGGDWTRQNYPMIITHISEQISPTRWAITFELAHPRRVIGADNLPEFPARVWDQLTKEKWDDQAERQWR